jgi:hypothetical protein
MSFFSVLKTSERVSDLALDKLCQRDQLVLQAVASAGLRCIGFRAMRLRAITSRSAWIEIGFIFSCAPYKLQGGVSCRALLYSLRSRCENISSERLRMSY